MIEQILSAFVTDAYADTIGGAPQQGGGISFVVLFVLFILFFYFGIWRPQNKRAKEQRSLMETLAKGDEVVTVGGILGRLTNVTDNYITLSIANNVEVHMQKSSVASVLPKGTLKSIE